MPIAEATKNFNSLPLPPRDIGYRVEPDGIRIFWKGSAKKYKLTFDRESSILTDSSHRSIEQEYLLPLVKAETTYSIQLQAVDRFGQESVLSKPLEVTRPKKDPFPDSRHFVKQRTTTTAELDWTKLNLYPIDPSSIKSWKVHYRQSEREDENQLGSDFTIPGYERGHELTDLIPDATYDVSLLADTENGQIVFFSETYVIPSVLPPPPHIRVRQVTDRSVTVEWERTNSNVDKYMLRLENQLRDEQIHTQTTKLTRHTFNNLRPDTEYIVEVYSMIDSSGLTSNESKNIQFRTSNPKQLNVPRNVRQVDQTSFSITVQWEMGDNVQKVHLRLLSGNVFIFY